MGEPRAGEADTLAGPDRGARPSRPIDPSAETRASEPGLPPLHADGRTLASDGPVPPPVAGEPPPRIGRFIVLRAVGAGGMGQVYAAYDPTLDRNVALKLVPSAPPGDGGEWQARLVREAQAMAKLSHPNVVTVHEVGAADDGQLYIVMELVDGQDLARLLAAEPRPWRDVLALFLAAGEGLAAAHAAGLVHRDFKPANVLVGVDGRVRVADFGLVHGRSSEGLRRSVDIRQSSPALANYLTRFGAVIGTPAYMAPEQQDGGVTDARSDIFSFCVALWEALYGQRPFGGATMTELLAAIRRRDVREPAPGREAPRWTRPILLQGLAADPVDRWQSMRALLDALARDPELERARRRRTALRLFVVLALGGALVWAATSLASVLRERAREAAAETRLADTITRQEALRADGREREADALFDAFLAAPEHAGTRATVQALRWRAAGRHADGDDDQALEIYSQAYAAAHHPDDVAAVLVDLAGVFSERHAWASLGWVLANLEARATTIGDRIAPLELTVAAYRRELARAGELAPDLASQLAALSRGEPSARTGRRAAIVDLDGDGAREVILWDSLNSSPRTPVARGEPGLPELTTLDLAALGMQLDRAISGPPGAPAWLFASDGAGERGRLYTWRRGALVEEAAWSTWPARHALAADLDHDGHDELYAAIGPYGRRIVGLRRERDAWREFQPSPTIDAIGSDVYSLAAADLDGDGRRELVAGLGPWGAYDFRVLRAGAPGQPYDQVARRKLGMVVSVVIFPDPEGPLIAVAKNPETLYAAPSMFPDGDHTGAPAGVYLFRLRGRALEQVAFAAVEPTTSVHDLAVADVDGDGQPELLAHLMSLGTEERALAVFRPRGPDGALTHVRIGQVALLAAGNLDDDPADELVIADTADADRVWTLGLGDRPLPPLDLGHPATAAPPPPELAGDVLLRDAWVHAGELAGLGLLAEAGRRFADLARAVPAGPVRGQALAQSGTLAADAGQLEVAAARFEEAARETGDRTLRDRAADSYERVGRPADAIRVLTDGDPADPATRARIDRHAALLASERVYSFDRPLDPAWTLVDPLALRHDPLRGVLTADLMHADPVLALPLVADRDHVVRVDLSLAAIGWGGGVSLRLRPDDPAAPATTIAFFSSGSSQGTDARLFFHILPDDPVLPIPVPRPDQRLTLELSHLATLGELRFTIALDGQRVGEVLRKLTRDLSGPLRLELTRGDPHGGRPADDEPWTRAVIHRVVTRGLHTREAALDPLAPVRRALVEGEGAEALALVAQPTVDPAAVPPLWPALAAQQASELSRAITELRRELVDAAPDARTANLRAASRLLRARGDQFGPLLRESLGGDAYLELFHATWADTAERGQTSPALVHALLSQLPRLPSTPPLTPQRAQQVAELRSARAAVHAHLGYTSRAHAELATLDPAALATSPRAARILRSLLLRLAILDLTEGHPDHAFLHLEALRTTMHPDLHADTLRGSRELAPLHADPRWQLLVGD